MKKLTLGLAVLLSGVAANSFASLPGGSKYGVCVPNFCGGFTFGIAGLYWRPSTSEFDHGLTYDDVASLFDFTDGRYHHVDQDYDWGFRVNVGYVFPCSGNDITLSWTHYDQDHTDRVENPGLLLPGLSFALNPSSPFAGVFPAFAPAITPVIPITAAISAAVEGTGVFTPLIAVPLTAASLDVAAAKADYQHDAVDLDFGQSIHVGCNLHFRWFGGLRYAKIEHKLNATYEAFDVVGTSIVPSTSVDIFNPAGVLVGEVGVSATFDILSSLREVVNQKSDFEGFGPRFGVDANYEFCGGFGIVAGISTSLLVGEIDSSLFDRFEDSSTATLVSATITGATGVTAPFSVAGVAIGEAGVSTPIGAVFTSADEAELSFKHPDEIQVVPNIDAKIGLDYSYAFCNPSHSKLTIEAGWLVSHYFNAIDRLSAVGGVAPEFRTRHVIDASFDGPYIGIQFTI